MHEDIARSLVEKLSGRIVALADTHCYPLVGAIGIEAVKKGLIAMGIDVDMDPDRKEMTCTLGMFSPSADETFNFSKTWSYDYILAGNKNYPYGSQTSLMQFGRDIMDDIETAAPQKIKNDAFHLQVRNQLSHFSAGVSAHVRSEILKLRDAALADRFLAQALYEGPSQLLPDVLARQNLSYYARAEELHPDGCNVNISSPASFQLATIDWKQFHEEYWPTPAALETFYWGLYLRDLAHLKGYDSRVSHSQSREYFTKLGADALFKGSEMTWGELAYQTN